MLAKALSDSFYNAASYKQTRFMSNLESRFGSETAVAVINFFKKAHLPVPKHEFLEGTEGPLIFLNPYGLVIRVEMKDKAEFRMDADRINSDPDILRPVGSKTFGKAVIEVCPGCPLKGATPEDVAKLKKSLAKRNIAFSDIGHTLADGVRNIGVLHVDGKRKPVVIDRLGVRKLTNETNKVLGALQKDEQERAYGSLARSFKHAWPDHVDIPDRVAMQMFLQKCVDYVKSGRLVAGWLEYEGADQKSNSVYSISKEYEGLMKGRFAPPSPVRKTPSVG